MNPAIYLRYLLLPIAVTGGGLLGGAWLFAVPVFCFVVHPLLGLMITGKKTETASPVGEYSPSAYRRTALFFVPVLTIVTAWGAWKTTDDSLSTFELTGLILSIGIMNGILGFTLAHECIHRRSSAERAAGHLLLLLNSYLHYSIEHIGGHHVYACTEKDPHTARFNESFYRFLPRAIAGTFLNAWRIERRRLKKKSIPTLSLSNRMLLFLLLQVLFLLAVLWIAGMTAIIFYLLQGAVAVGLLHITNYLQHYGLVRRETVNGQIEKIKTHHAWSTGKGQDGLNLFQIDKHADHHMHPGKSYEQLTAHEDSPVMPTGYSGMILLACLPPLWFRIMNNRILSLTPKHQQQ